jgi:hypothetical protein
MGVAAAASRDGARSDGTGVTKPASSSSACAPHPSSPQGRSWLSLSSRNWASHSESPGVPSMTPQKRPRQIRVPVESEEGGVQHGVANKQIKRMRIEPAALTAPHARTAPHRMHSLHFCRYHTANILQFNAIVGHVAISNSVLNNVSDFVSAGGSARPPPAETNLETIKPAIHGQRISHTTYDTLPVSKFPRRNLYRTPLSVTWWTPAFEAFVYIYFPELHVHTLRTNCQTGTACTRIHVCRRACGRILCC